MNKDLKKFIDNYGGLRDEDFLLEVGRKHKDLPNKEKDWKELTSYLKLNIKPTSFRSWIYRRLKGTGELKVKNIKNEIIPDEDLYKERIKVRDAINSYRGTLRQQAREENFREDIKQSISKLNKLPKVKVDKSNTNSNSEAILMLSDLHIGADCENFYNTYNSEVAASRLSKLVTKTISYCKLHKVGRLHVVGLGDFIQGLIHVNARVQQQMDVADQVIQAAELLANTLNELQKAAPYITYRSCSDNHSRMHSNKDDAVAGENFGKIIYWYLKERLKDTKVEFREDNIDYGLGSFTLFNGKTVMFAHGHEENYNQVIQNWTAANNRCMPDYVLLAHFHNTKLKSFQGSRVFVNGSICGTEDYALSKRLFSKPEQTLLVFPGKDLVQYIISLEE